jgi:PAS domain S-box-containing protein
LVFLSVSVVTALITHAREKALHALNESLAAQRHSEARIRAMTDSVAEALVLISPDQQILDVNQRFEEMFGIPPGRVLGQPFGDLQPLVRQVFADPERFARLVTKATEDERGDLKEVFVQNWPKPRELELFLSPVVEEGEPHEHYGRLLVFRDVTHEREVDRMKTEFVSLVSHELRTPLTSIKGFTDMVLDGDAGEINEDVQEFLGIVKANVDRLVSLVNDLLDISRIESGRIKLDVKSLAIGPIVDEVITVMRPLIEEKGQSLAVDISPAARWIQGDRDKIVQVLTNYVSNAYKYTPAGGAIRIEVTEENNYGRVAVVDNGFGIAPEDQEQLFTRFYRVDSSLTAEIGGTGLGLSIVKSIIELHGGWVGLTSEPGQGSTFYFTVPLATEPPEAPVPGEREAVSPERQAPVLAVSQAAQVPERVPAAGRTILVVEDDPQISRLVCAHLEKAGYLVQEAASVEDVLERIAQEPPDLITLDIELLGTDGFEWVEQLAASPATRDIPILIVTVFDRDLQNPQFAVSALPRPVDREQLLQMVAQLLVESARQRVLVVEDDASTRELLSAALQKRGFEVLLAEDGASGLAVARGEQPGLVLLDLRLPGMDGLAVLQALKQEPATAAIPVITMTGSEGLNDGIRARVLSLGASDFVTKPFDLDMLIQEILVFVQQEEV